jgi:tRNA(Ile)-lysidine synthase
MCLANLLIEAKIPFELAHVNFQLRGEESDGDRLFVQNWAKRQGVPFHLKLAETTALADSKGISIQMAAREIRYAFFEEVRATRNLAAILLAHQEDDQLETIFLNLLRGTGIEGIYGMADKKGLLIRPLLPFSRSEIRSYMDKTQLAWRDDSSNEKADYKRNNLRINGIPALLALEPDAKKNLFTSFNRLKDTGRAFTGLFENWKKSSIRTEESYQFLPYSAFHNQPGAATLLYFWLRPFGFNSDQAQSIAEAVDHPKVGTLFRGSGYSVHLDRQELILAPDQEAFEPFFLQKDDTFLDLPEGKYTINRLEYTAPFDRNPTNAQLDVDRLEFPFEIRTWQEGDKFEPLGMNSSKKISDFLIDSKVPLAKKQGIKVLVSGGKIAWVIGWRIADWAKCNPATRRILYFKKN